MLCIPVAKAGKMYDTRILSRLAIRPGRKWQTKTKGAKPVNGDPTHIVRLTGSDSGAAGGDSFDITLPH